MKTDLLKVFKLSRYFRILKESDLKISYRLEEASRILQQNIHANWLESILMKTHKSLPVYVNGHHEKIKKMKIPYGFINTTKIDDNDQVFEQDFRESCVNENTELKFSLIVHEQDAMQYFVQWQRYRKFWWSSITTTPSLFYVEDMKHGTNSADVNIITRFPWGNEIVEKLEVKYKENIIKNTSQLNCTMGLKKALLILLLDGLNNSTKEGYLRLHRTMAPYQISYILDDESSSRQTLKELAFLLDSQLVSKKISTLLPDFSLPMESQLLENLHIGVPYTAVLDEGTLSNGIFRLLNSSTMLKEQVHVADFDSYAALLCGK